MWINNVENKIVLGIGIYCHQKLFVTWKPEHGVQNSLISVDNSEFLAGVVPSQKPALDGILVLGCIGMSATSEIATVMLPFDWEAWHIPPIPELCPHNLLQHL